VIEVIQAAAEVQAECERNGWQFCFIGGLALQRWGEPRVTADVDLTLLTGFGTEERFVDLLLKRFEPRISDAKQFALMNRALLLRAKSGVGIDVALAAFPFEETAIARSTTFLYPGDVPIRTCSAEDLIVMKAFANRPKDWVDVAGIITRQTGKLDWNYIRAQIGPLAALKESPEISDELERCRNEFERQ
jgi:hypothetical protein